MLNALPLNKLTEFASGCVITLQQNKLTSIFLAAVPVISGTLSYLKTPTVYVVAATGALTVVALAVSFLVKRYLKTSEEQPAKTDATATDQPAATVAEPVDATTATVVEKQNSGWFSFSRFFTTPEASSKATEENVETA